MEDRIRISGPWITQKEIDYVSDAVANAWYGDANIYHRRFEAAFCKYIGCQYALCLPSCTSAIHLSLLALGIGKGDEVIVPDVTWIASSAPISYVGASPVFADIDPKTWCLSVASFKECITPRTKAVIPVDLYGNIPDMDEIRRIAKDNGIAIIEDAAEAIGAEYKGKKAGSFGTTGTFSFHGSKTLTTGEGGMFTTDWEDLYQRVIFLMDHGRSGKDYTAFLNTEVAYKYKMSSMQAALGLAQLERIDELVLRKRQIFDWYKEELAHIKGITLNSESLGTFNTYWMVTVILDSNYNLTKERVIEELGKKGIDCRPFFYPLSAIPAYASLTEARRAQKRNLVSYAISRYGVNLPSGLNLCRSDVARVCGSFRELIGVKNG